MTVRYSSAVQKVLPALKPCASFLSFRCCSCCAFVQEVRHGAKKESNVSIGNLFSLPAFKVHLAIYNKKEPTALVCAFSFERTFLLLSFAFKGILSVQGFKVVSIASILRSSG
jgi:hypothetical protein